MFTKNTKENSMESSDGRHQLVHSSNSGHQENLWAGGGFVSSHFFLVGGCFGGFCVQNIFLKFLAPLCSEKPNRVLSSSMSYLMLCRFVDSLKARKLNASAGNRTRVTSMATMYSTTRPLMHGSSISCRLQLAFSEHGRGGLA